MAQSTYSICATGTIPASAGIGFRSAHFRHIIENLPKLGWLEVHSENYFGAGGTPLRQLESLRTNYPVSLHGVGLSLGSSDPLDYDHLRQLKQLIARIEPGLVSEHLSWGSFGGRFLNDLLPLPYTEEALTHVVERLLEIQDFLGQSLLIENPSSYLEFEHSTLTEWDFLAEAARRSGARILLDVNNVYVSCHNHAWDPLAYLRGIPSSLIAEFHLAGHTRKRIDDLEVLIDTHDQPISDSVWAWYGEAVRRFGPRPTLIERDANLPPFAELLAEATRANTYLENHHAIAA